MTSHDFYHKDDATPRLSLDQAISAQEVADRLRVSRHYVNQNIQPHIRAYCWEKSSDTSVYFDKKELRYWLMINADFSRQTWRFKEGDPPPERGKHKPPLIPYQRNKTPSVLVMPFDFLDLPLIFPKEYRRPGSDKVTSAEICYRDMFKAGAVKIQLGSKKTMFYIPGLDSNDPKAIQAWADRPFDDPDIPLLPAIWLPIDYDCSKIFYPETPANRKYIGSYQDQAYDAPNPFVRPLHEDKPIDPDTSKVFDEIIKGGSIADSFPHDEDTASPMPLAYNIDPLDEIRSRQEIISIVSDLDESPYPEDDDSLDDLIEHAECYMPPAKIDGTPPTPIDDDPESEESMEDLMYHADQYFQPGDDIEYYDPNHDWYVQNWEGEDIPGTSWLKIEDDDDRTDK